MSQSLVTLVKSTQLSQLESDCLVLPVFSRDDEKCVLTPLEKRLDRDTLYHLKQLVDDDQFSAKSKQRVLSPRPVGLSSKRVLLLGLGSQPENLEEQHRLIKSLAPLFSALFDQLKPTRAKQIHLLPGLSEAWFIKGLISQYLNSQYQFEGYKTSQSEPHSGLKLGILLDHPEKHESIQQTCIALDKGLTLTKDLANAAANLCTPETLAQSAQRLDDEYLQINTDIVKKQTLTELGMNAYLAVNQGSKFEATMPVIHYQGAKPNIAPVVLIGKGVTFDTGGISLKKADGMQHMIYDMAGAASVLGVMKAVAELKLPINLIGILATAENAIDGNAYRPGDILTTASGQTVEVISTDAEGRLVMCDALTFAQRFKPKAVIDIATLTGAAIVALGHHATGLMSNNKKLEAQLIEASDKTHDRVWPFPLWDEYQSALDSAAADMVNSGTNSPGMITAGCFLSRFASTFPWAHLDVAGTSFRYGKQNTATGRPVSLIVEFLSNSGF